MKHIDLIKLIYEHKETIDQAYRNEAVHKVDERLLDSTLFVKIGNTYTLNKNYTNFADAILQRIDYNIIFGDYEQEYKELVKFKNRFLKENNAFYKKSILRLIENLYIKFFNRDREISALLVKLENDTSLEIDILIENANDILKKIEELIIASDKIGTLFRDDLKYIDQDITALLQWVSIYILLFIENIDGYIKQLNRFILQTKKKRLENKNLLTLASLILDEKATSLEEYLAQNALHFYHTIHKSQKNRVAIYPDDREIRTISKEVAVILQGVSVNRPLMTSPIKQQKREPLNIIDIDKIMSDLRKQKSDDIFKFIYMHEELHKHEASKNMAFKVFLQIVMDENVKFDKTFNEYGIKVAKWA
jgi:hypothetical protein